MKMAAVETDRMPIDKMAMTVTRDGEEGADIDGRHQRLVLTFVLLWVRWSGAEPQRTHNGLSR